MVANLIRGESTVYVRSLMTFSVLSVDMLLIAGPSFAWNASVIVLESRPAGLVATSLTEYFETYAVGRVSGSSVSSSLPYNFPVSEDSVKPVDCAACMATRRLWRSGAARA